MLGIDSGVIEGQPTGLQSDPLLWIKQLGLHRRNAEELGIEQIDVVDQARITAGVMLSRGGIVPADASPPPPIPGRPW